METGTQPRKVLFGPFEFEPGSGRLTKHGYPIKLQRKSVDILLCLLETPGERVSRNQLEKRLWPEGTYVDYDLGVRVALKKLRNALGDSSDVPRYIETIRGEGYRFIAPVEFVAASTPSVDVTPPPAPPLPFFTQTRGWAVAMMAGAALTVLLIVIVAARRGFVPQPGSQAVAERMTSNAPEQAVLAAAISPDGRYLAYSTRQGIWLKQISSGEVHRVEVQPALLPHDLSWYGDSGTMLATDQQGVWKISILGGAAQRVYGPAAFARVAHDGKHLAVTSRDRTSIWVADSGGEHAHQVAGLPSGIPGYLSVPAWSPKDKRVAYMKHWALGEQDLADIETVHPDGSAASVVLTRFPIAQILWMDDGRLLFGVVKPPQGTNNLWSIPVDEESGQATSAEQPLTAWPDFNFIAPSSTSDGRTIAFVRMLPQADVYTSELDPDAAKLGPVQRATFASSFTYNYPGAWDVGDRTLLMVTSNGGKKMIVRQPLDGSPAAPVVPVSDGSQFAPQLSPDGRWLLWIRAAKSFTSAEVFRMPRGGGPAEVVDRQPGEAFQLRCPSRGEECVFAAQGNDELVFRAVSPELRAARELFRWKTPGAAVVFDVAPEGDKLLVCQPQPSADKNSGKVFVVDLPDGGNRRDLPFGCPENLATWRWLPNRKGWLLARILIPAGSEVLRVDASGGASVLWKSGSQRLGEPTISTDGRHVALVGFSSERNAWVLRF